MLGRAGQNELTRDTLAHDVSTCQADSWNRVVVDLGQGMKDLNAGDRREAVALANELGLGRRMRR